MKLTGIVRKIDELGRIVLPKELRKTLNINTGDDFQISIDNEKIILEKYFILKNKEEDLIKIIDCFNNIDENKIFLIINNKIVNKNDDLVSEKVKEIILTRRIYINENINKYIISKNIIEEGKIIISPIVYNSDLLGSLVIIGPSSSSELNKISKIVTKLIINSIS